MVSLLNTPGSRMTELSGTNAAPGAHAMLAYDKTGHAMLMAKGLPAPPPGKAYQLWFIMDNKKMPGKVFSTDASGNGVWRTRFRQPLSVQQFSRSRSSPKAASKIPTGEIYLLSAS